MLIWLVGCRVQIGHLAQGMNSDAEKAGAAIGTTMGTGMLLMFWVFGVVILGALTYFSPGPKSSARCKMTASSPRSSSRFARTASCRPSTLAMLLIASLAIAGCADEVGSIDDRAQTINQETADYGAAAVLLNILRSGSAEPLNFVALTGNTGHESLTSSLGLPTFFIGPPACGQQTDPIRSRHVDQRFGVKRLSSQCR